MVIVESLALIGAGVWELFTYNRGNFSFNKELNQDRIYHTQKMRNEQVGLYRDDVRDLFGLTIAKMDVYIIVNSLMLLLAVALFYEGRMPAKSPEWLFILWAISLSEMIMMPPAAIRLFLSSFQVRLSSFCLCLLLFLFMLL
jgi:hypothetical protein